MRIHHLLLACIASAALAIGQTTGVPGINDYTIGGSSCAGSTSCFPCCVTTPASLVCTVNTAPGNFAIFIWSFCPCSAGFLCGATNACLPAIPLSACSGSTNQSFDVTLGCVTTTSFAVANAAGSATFTLNIPTLGPAPPCSIGPLATQAVVIDTCGLGAPGFLGPFVVTQAYSVLFD